MPKVYLYDMKKGAKILCECSDGSEYIVFDHIDGMYSYSMTEKGNGPVHLGASTVIIPYMGSDERFNGFFQIGN